VKDGNGSSNIQRSIIKDHEMI